MCQVKTGAKIRNMQDVQNLVTGIIFRQNCEFGRTELLNAVNYNMQGSPISEKHEDIENIVDYSLHIALENDWLVRNEKMYRPSLLFEIEFQ